MSIGEYAQEGLTRIIGIGRDLAAKRFLRVSYAQFDIVLSTRHQTKNNDDCFVGFLVNP